MKPENRSPIKLWAPITLCVIALISQFLSPTLSQAASGMPSSTEFGYGARIDPWGPELDLSLRTASQIGLDWIGVDFNWARLWPDRSTAVDLVELNQVMDYAKGHNLSVLLSISHAPSWASTPHGPDPELTAGLISQMTRLYPDALLAIELFPSANTFEGWGAAPDAAGYARLLDAAARTLQSSGHTAVLVAAGLTPIDPSSQSRDMDDLAFLDQLYQAGAAVNMPVIGVRLPNTDPDPLAAPKENHPKVLRHYEAVRAVMIENGHSNGLVWITGYTWPETTGDPSINPGASTADPDRLNHNWEADWVVRALQMMKSQLYIGAAFHQCLNPSQTSMKENVQAQCLIRYEDEQAITHPGLNALAQVISLRNPNLLTTFLEKKLTPDKSKTLSKQGAP